MVRFVFDEERIDNHLALIKRFNQERDEFIREAFIAMKRKYTQYNNNGIYVLIAKKTGLSSRTIRRAIQGK